MTGLNALFADIVEGLSRDDEGQLSGFPDSRKGKPDSQTTDDKSISGISGISGDERQARCDLAERWLQARADAGGGARTRVSNEKPPETPEQPEKLAGAKPYLPGSSSLKPEKPEKKGGEGLLPATPSSLSPDEAAAFDERAAFLEYECELSRADAEYQARRELRFGSAAPGPTQTRLPDRDGLDLWRAGFALLKLHNRPCPGYREGEWPKVYARAASFLDNYGAQAEALGWTASRLFGVHPEAGIVRVDHCGALVLPIGGPVLALTATEIRFGHLTHREKPGRPEGVPIWHLAASRKPPS